MELLSARRYQTNDNIRKQQHPTMHGGITPTPHSAYDERINVIIVLY